MTETPPDYSPGETTPVAPTLGPHAPSANVVSVRPSPDVTPLAAVPSTPPWLLSHDAPSRMPARFEFPSHAHGPENPEMPFSWPHCGHALHLGCVADLVADVRDLRCPTCRAPWPPQAADTFIHACCAHSVPAAQPGPDHDTTSRQYHEDVAPRPPTTHPAVLLPELFGRPSGFAVDELRPLLQDVPAPPVCPRADPHPKSSPALASAFQQSRRPMLLHTFAFWHH